MLPKRTKPLDNIGLDKQKNHRKIVNICLPVILAYVVEAQRDSSFEYPQHMFCLRNMKIISLLRTLN